METVTLSSKYQLVLPKGGVTFLALERPMRAHHGIARGVRVKGLREKTDRP